MILGSIKDKLPFGGGEKVDEREISQGDIEYRLPELMTEDEIKTLAIIGAPRTGKTHALTRSLLHFDELGLIFSTYEKLEEEKIQKGGLPIDSKSLTSLRKLTESEFDYDFLIFDDFYKVLDECVRGAYAGIEEKIEKLKKFLENTQYVCLSTTPYRWNYILRDRDYRGFLEKRVDNPDEIEFDFLKWGEEKAREKFSQTIRNDLKPEKMEQVNIPQVSVDFNLTLSNLIFLRNRSLLFY